MPDFKSPSDLSMDEIVAKMRRLVGADEPPTVPAAAHEDVLELTEAIDDDGRERHLGPFAAAAVEAAPPAAFEAALVAVPTVAPTSPPEMPPNPGTRTLEDVVSDLLRPMLQRWLDDNLPGIVERLVQAEIARGVRPSGAPGGGARG